VQWPDRGEVGPISTREVAESILEGKLPYDVLVAAPSSKKWLRAAAVPVISEIVESEPTRVTIAPPVPTPTPATKMAPRSPIEEEEARTPRAVAPPTTRPYRKFDVTVESAGVTHRGKGDGSGL
jgi:hypothetical protein